MYTKQVRWYIRRPFFDDIFAQ